MEDFEYEYNEGQAPSHNPGETQPEENVWQAHSAQSEQTVQEEPPVQPEEPLRQDTGAYHGAGVGQKESPFASSPYYTAQQARQAGYEKSDWQQPEQTAKPPRQPRAQKPRRHMSRRTRRLLSAVAALAVMLGSCGITAALVNQHWERELGALEQSMEDRLNQLDIPTQQVPAQSSVSGTVVSNGSLSPSQVYAMNVNSVVSISNYATTTNQYSYFFGGGSTQQQVVSTGSGFILSSDGYVITNYHVVEDAEKLTVTTYAGDEYEATLVGGDSVNDVALLKVEATGLSAVTIGSSDALNVGDQVVAIGNPLGELTSTQTVGYISGKGRSVTTDNTIINMLQTDAAINSGNSGGPLFNMNGEVVGITTAKYSGSSGSGATIEGIGFAIPIDDVMSMIEDFRNYGYLKNQAYLGVEVRNLDSSTASMYSLPSGSYVTKVVEGGSAARAGVQEKDIITAIGEYEISGNSELTVALRRFSAGDTTTITVFRAGQEMVLDITFDEKPQDTDSTDETISGEMPENGSYEEWYNYFAPYFGGGNG